MIPVLTLQECDGRQHALLILYDSFSHLYKGGRRCIISRTITKKIDDFCPAFTRAFDNRINLFLFKEAAQRYTANAGISNQRDHIITMSPEDKSFDILNRIAKHFCDKSSEPCGVKDSRLSNDSVFLKAGFFEYRIGHRIDWICQYNNCAFRRIPDNFTGDRSHYLL